MCMVVFHILLFAIAECKKKHCLGCNLSPPVPGQSAHMVSGGCLDESTEGLELYVRMALDYVSINDLIAVYKTVSKVLGVIPKGFDLLARAPKAWILENQMIKAIKDSVKIHEDEPSDYDVMLYSVNVPLMDIVQEVCVELCIPQNICAN